MCVVMPRPTVWSSAWRPPPVIRWRCVAFTIYPREGWFHVSAGGTQLIVLRVQVQTYERLTPLVPLRASFGDSLAHVRKGDCLIAFGRKKIYSLKRMVEMSTKYKCCVVYGRLPPEARAKQAALFNAPDSGFDVLVASDAVGMGLNLNIRRIVFESLEKFDGTQIAPVSPTQVKQIAGRAGRYKSRFPEGEVPLLMMLVTA